MYAQLCKRFAEHAPNFESPDTKITTFKRLLLNKCRDEFENRAAVSATFEKRAGHLTGDEEEARYIAKRKMLGNIKFIGELGKLEILHDSILHRCCEQLLVGRKKQPITEQGEDLECLAYLFKTCGRILDSPKAKLLVDQYFERIRGIIANVDTPTRIKFLLQDVIEMRENKWMPRKLATPDGPRTIQQVREDAARDGCIYLPQQDVIKNNPVPSQLQEVLFSKSRNKGMEDIFGGPGPQGPASLGTGPGVIGGDTEGYGIYDSYRGDESRDHLRDYKPKRDSFESKFAERPDFGDRFTANRNKTHPSNRGRGGGGGRMMDNGGGYGRSSNGYGDRNGSGGPPHYSSGGDKDLPPRFKKMGYGSGTGDIQLRPSSNSMMLKPKTPSSLPKSATARLDGGIIPSNSTPKLMMTTAEPPVFISKPSVDKKRQEKKNQGPTREEVFNKIEEVLQKLLDTSSTNEAFTIWKEGDIPAKMVNNALIHLFKQVVKMNEEPSRELALQLVEQLAAEETITQVHCKEGLSRLIQSFFNLEAADGGMVHLAVWSLNTDKVKVAELAEMTEGGSTHPYFLSVLQRLSNSSEDSTLSLFKESGVKLLDQLPEDLRTEEHLSSILQEKKLAFLVPLLTIKGELSRQLEAHPTSDALLAWIQANVLNEHQSDPAFVYALMSSLLRYIIGQTEKQENLAEAEKEWIFKFKPVLKSFLRSSADLQLSAIYALQVYCYSAAFPKGLLLRWFVALYEADIIEETVFLSWKEDVNDTYPGKGKALFQVNQWLTWLEEAESEEEDDEE